jgi:hypothetical protein
MKKAIYAVLKIGREWRVVCERRHIGHYDTRNEALSLGASLVRQAIESGCEAELLAVDAVGKLVGQRFEPRTDAQPAES